MAYSCPDKQGLVTQTHVWEEKQRIQASKERMWGTTGEMSDSLEPCVPAHLVPDSVALGRPHPLCMPQFPLLYQEWVGVTLMSGALPSWLIPKPTGLAG